MKVIPIDRKPLVSALRLTEESDPIFYDPSAQARQKALRRLFGTRYQVRPRLKTGQRGEKSAQVIEMPKRPA
jgi:hypothetical protein